MQLLLKDQAYQALLEMIWSGNLEAGEIYSLTKIAQDLNISRTPLRDAIQRLSDEKRIDILPSRGFCLHKFTEEEIKQRYHLTISLEGYSIVRLIEKYKENPKNPYIMKLEECVDLMENGLNEEHTFKEKYNYDNVFHNTLVESLDDNFPEYLSLKDHGFINIPELHIYAKYLDMKVMLAFNKRTLNAIKTGNYEDGYKCMIENADYVYNIYIEQSNK
ncbi:GntR family transcriptional regulator [uncultured Thomasclavelia sp.]|uniref:GntR family transcriptional regulator n=1 Tax=uncultured Thomasclavelia sp. TaxID=3025759 RepID=UPI0025DBD4A6|nr:GntR family transcriptional regulator [uncultured Thomasclavelia sp.]